MVEWQGDERVRADRMWRDAGARRRFEKEAGLSGTGTENYDSRFCEWAAAQLRQDLTVAPGAADLTFGSLLLEMLRHMFERYKAPRGVPSDRDYTMCKVCGGNDLTRAIGQRPSLERVEHKADCELAKHMPRLMAMASKDVT